MTQSNVDLVLAGVAVLVAAALQDMIPATRLVPVKWPFLPAVALYYALAGPVVVALTVAVWAGMLTDALGGLPMGGTCVLLVLTGLGARQLRGPLGGLGGGFRGAVLGAAGASLQQVWVWLWVGGSAGVSGAEMLRLAGVSVGAGAVLGGVVFGVLGALAGGLRPPARNEG